MVAATASAKPSLTVRGRISASLELARFVWESLVIPWPWYSLFAAVAVVLGGIAPVVLVKATVGLIDALQASASRAGLPLIEALRPFLPWLALFVGVKVLTSLLLSDTIQNYLTAQLSERVTARYEALMYSKAFGMSLDRFESPDFFESFNRAKWAMQERVISIDLPKHQAFLTTVVGGMGLMIVAASVHWSIPFLMLVGGAAMAQRSVREIKANNEVWGKQAKAKRRLEYWRGLVSEREAAAEVRLFGLGAHVRDSWKTLNDSRMREVSLVRRSLIPKAVPPIALNLAILGGTIALLLYQASSGAISAGTVVAMITVTQMYLSYVNGFGGGLLGVGEFLGLMDHASRFLKLAGDEKATAVEAPSTLKQGIEFKSVTYKHTGGKKTALDRVDFRIRPGERVALVGENGAGKTTLTKLLLGLYTPTEGAITVGGVDLREIDQKSWRDRTGVVFQEFVKFAFTVEENIGLGRTERMNNRAAVEAAAAMSGSLQDIRKLPKGFETPLGKEFEGGMELSRGQWQKLAIARVYLRNAEILVLDEPTSALDALADLEVYRQFLDLSKGKTVLIISHRLGSARLADRIVFMETGRIVQEGSHDELVARGGPYAELYKLQAEWYR
ncbi:MAG: ABC transporter ATP-binding protein [SAR202 cluster bacterium]|nr:ABC transporter ATP-binding protein [SAR202 cluster bacterium]